MRKLHRLHLMALASLGLAVSLAGVARAEDADPKTNYFGRWTVSDDKPVFSSKGKLYKTFDIAPCGKDFCGVSVGDGNSCGATLFRFLTAHAENVDLTGHGLWGQTKKKLMIEYLDGETPNPYLMLGLGADDFDFGAREGSMPIFEANYKRTGDATCTAK